MATDRRLLVARLEQLVADLGLRPGERLGTERDLAERLGVGRTALRGALDDLQARDRVRRVMGATGGVFVSDGRIERRLNTVEGVPTMLRQQGVRVTTTVVRADLGLGTPSEHRALGLADDAFVVRLVRRRDADGRPWSLETSVLPAALVPGLLSYDLAASLYALLAERYRLVPAEADEEVDVLAVDGEVAAHLGVPPGSAALQVWRVARGADGVAFEFAHDLFRADRTRLHLRRYGASWKRVSRP